MLIKNSANDYLEIILILNRKNGSVRSVDVSKELGVTKPSVCNAMKKLKDQRMIYFGDDGHIFLTEGGKIIAEKVHGKRRDLAKVLTGIGVSEDTAAKEAGLIEHVISDETYRCLKSFFKLCPQVSSD